MSIVRYASSDSLGTLSLCSQSSAASPMLTVLDGSSTEHIDGTMEGSEGEAGEEVGSEEERRGSVEKGGGIRYENKASLAHDLQFLANMPELCDVTFLVGEERQPICGVRAILAARSRIFRRLLFGENGQRKMGKKKVGATKPPDGYIEKYDFRGQPTIVITDFEPQVFKLLVDYVHTGSVMMQARCLLGLMNAADHYGLEDLKLACIHFMEHCISVDTVCSLLTSAEKYIQYKSTKILVQKMFEFVDQNAERILSLGAFQQLPQHVVRIVLGREDLAAKEVTKFNAAYRWTLRYVDDHQGTTLAEVFEPFVDVIDFVQIPAKELMQNVRRAGVVEDKVILNALAFQADPTSVAQVGPQHRLRKATTVASDMTSSHTPSPLSHAPKIRRAQSSNQNLKPTTEPGGQLALPMNTRKRGASVPSLHIEDSKLAAGDLLPSKIEVHPMSSQQEPLRLRDSQVSSSSGSISSPPGDSYQDSSYHDNSYHGSLSSLGTVEGEGPECSSPLNLSRQQRPFLPYNTLDIIVSASNHDNRPVDV